MLLGHFLSYRRGFKFEIHEFTYASCSSIYVCFSFLFLRNDFNHVKNVVF